MDATDNRPGGKCRPRKLVSTLLAIAPILLGTVVAEGMMRNLDDLRPLGLGTPPGAEGEATAVERDRIPLAPGVLREWFVEDPPPLPNRIAPKPGWQASFDEVKYHPGKYLPFTPADLFKAWNSVFAGDICKNRLLSHGPGPLYVYDPPDGQPLPRYRFIPNSTTPLWLVTNQIGWRGPPIIEPRDPRTIRIVFVGASTTVDGHHLPFSYPEYVGYWLNRWAATQKLDVRFETLNAGRESITSQDIAQIVRNEVMPLQPDFVIYYEGRNQFWLPTVIPSLPDDGSVARPKETLASPPSWLLGLMSFSALARRLQAETGYTGVSADGREWPKPDYEIVLPPALDERNPDIRDPRLPLHLDQIVHDLDEMRLDLNTIGAQFIVSSFVWMAKDGLTLDPIRHKYLLEDLNINEYPLHYRDLVRLAAFQNRVFANYAKANDLPFIDVARDMPLDPALFDDAVHTNAGGTRMRAWIVLQQLIPIIQKRLASGSLPKVHTDAPLPTYTPRQIMVDCKSGG